MILVLSIKSFIESSSQNTIGSVAVILLVFIGIISALLNSILNLFLLNKFYPDRIISKKLERLSLISFCINIIFWFILALLFISSIPEMTAEDFSFRNWGMSIALIISFLIIIFQLVVLILQLTLPGTIVRNNRTQVAILIDSIGQPNLNL